MWLIYYVFITLLGYLIYINVKNSINYWKNKGIQYIKPWPVIGNFGKFIIGKKSFAGATQTLYNAFPEARYIGYHHFAEPSLLIRDPDIIKQMMVDDFDLFPDRRLGFAKGIDSIWDKSILVVTGEEWHDMRRILSPTFTSLRMRIMFDQIKDTTAQLTEYYGKKNGIITLEMKDVFTKSAIDLIVNTIFGIRCDSFKNPENEIYLMAKQLNDTNNIGAPSFIIHMISPTILKYFNLKVVTEVARKFFANIIEGKVTESNDVQILRPGLVQSLLETRKFRSNPNQVVNVKKFKSKITDDDIIAQATAIFIAGFDTTAVVLAYITYELAINPDIQERLREEIDRYWNENNGVVEYETLLTLPYLEKVVLETLRKWPGTEFSNRKCAKPYTIPAKLPNEKPLRLDTNMHCIFPVYAIHRDAKYYPDPEKFDPERFSDENKQNRNPFAFLPFGAGPRNCIGNRFALLALKFVIFEVLRNFKIVPVVETQIPLKLKNGSFFMVTEKGIWLGLESRKLM